jgi:glycosyltransferase involved in cell wall biosynthesis
MRVLHVIPSISPVRGGPSQAILQMVKELQSQGIDAEIATTNDNGDKLLDVPLYDRIKYQQIPVRFFPRFSPNISAIREFAFSSSFTTWLWQNISNYDLLHVHAIFSYTSTVTMAIARYHQIPYIVRPLGQLCSWSLTQSPKKKQIYLKLIERANINHSQALHFTAELERQEVSKLDFTPPNFVLPLGLALPTFIPEARQKLRQQLNKPADEPVILFLSRIHEKKGLDYLISALGKLRNNYRFTFILAGSGSAEYQAEVERMLEQNRISDRTYKLGFIEGETKNICLQGADLYTLTSHSENFGIAVLEALASGTPALVTRGVALSDLVKEQNLGWVVDLNVEAIANSIQEFLDNPDMAKQKGDRATEYVAKHYSWEKIALNLKAIYAKILAI